jgi:hypothetical protein
MFAIYLRRGAYLENADVRARAMNLASAIGFVRSFCYDGIAIESNWVEFDGRYTLEVFDWLDGWFTNPQPIARITAPVGYLPAEIDLVATNTIALLSTV